MRSHVLCYPCAPQAELFKALRRTRLVSEDAAISSMKYSRCGRTDKGVSGLGQVGGYTVVR